MNTASFWRFRLVQYAVLLVAVLITVQILLVQHGPVADQIWEDVQELQIEGHTEIVYPERGSIYDRNGHILATNQPYYSLRANLEMIRYQPEWIEEWAREIAQVANEKMGLDYETTLTKILGAPEGSKTVLLGRYIPYDSINAYELYVASDEVVNTATAYYMQALNTEPEYVRNYPEKDLAANLLGLITLNNTRSYGVEAYYDSLLSGSPEARWIPNDPTEADKQLPPPSSTTLILTIDRDIQYATEQILDDAIDTYGAKSGVIIVEDPKTGEILAMASYPRLDPNEYWEYAMVQGDVPYNASVSAVYEPGSVMKILTMAAAVDAGVVQPNETYNDITGFYEIDGFFITNWNDLPGGLNTMTECLEHSLNVCLAYIANERLGPERFYAYMQAFGIGHLTGIDLAEEEVGRLKLPPTDGSYWPRMELGINAYGQGISVTPIQMVMATSAVPNKGVMMRPHVLKATVRDGVLHEMPLEVVGRPISETTAATLNQMLTESLGGETYVSLTIPGYKFAGKTGTGTIQTENTNLTNASFVGWGPTEDPQFLVYIWLEKPTSSVWATETAAPVFKQLAEKLIILMGIPPDYIRLGTAGQ